MEGLYDVANHHGNLSFGSPLHPVPVWPGGRALAPYPRPDPDPSSETAGDVVKSSPEALQEHTTANNVMDPAEDADNEEKVTGVENRRRLSQVPATLTWLAENYELAEGVCLPRCVLYSHYLDFCKRRCFIPAGAATFGKVIRQRFPKLTTRRLGTRGQSKYHYYGIGIKETSIYYHSVYTGKGLTRFSGVKIKTEGSNRKYSLSSKTGTLLPEFPDVNNLLLPSDMDIDKLETFLLMYRTHCQRILDTVISANFEEVQSFLLHYWQGMPPHLTVLLDFRLVTDLVALCDSILYKVLIDVLIPSTIQDVPDSLSCEIKAFVRRLPVWLENALEMIPENLKTTKLKVARGFTSAIRRQISFVHLAQTARTVLTSPDTVSQMTADLAAVDFPGLCCQAGFTRDPPQSSHTRLVLQYFREFQTMLGKQSAVETFTEWLDSMVDRCVLKPCGDVKKSLQTNAAEFLLQWAVYNSLLMRDLTLLSASSFGSFHLVHMMLDEYVLLVMETQLSQLREAELLRAVQRHMRQAGEINMQPKVRAPAGKSQHSVKAKKRKVDEDQCDSDDSNEAEEQGGNPNQETINQGCDQTGVTAFSRPAALGCPTNHTLYRDGSDGVMLHPSPVCLSSRKHVDAQISAHQDRAQHYQPFSINSYTEIISPGSSFAPSRAITDSGFGPVSFSNSLPSSSPSYWPDTRQHPHYGDPYSSYAYSKFPTSYECYGKPGLLRNGSYTEALNRSALEVSRAYYGRPHDGYQVNSPLSVGSYGANFMDIAPPSAPYGRPEAMLFQEEVLPSSLGALSGYNKPFLSASFR